MNNLMPPLHVTIDNLDTGESESYYIEGAQWVEHDSGISMLVIQRPAFRRVEVPVPSNARVSFGVHNPLVTGIRLSQLPEDGTPLVCCP